MDLETIRNLLGEGVSDAQVAAIRHNYALFKAAGDHNRGLIAKSSPGLRGAPVPASRLKGVPSWAWNWESLPGPGVPVSQFKHIPLSELRGYTAGGEPAWAGGYIGG